MSCRFVCSRTRPFFSFVRGWQGSGQSRRSSYFCPGKERKDLAASQPFTQHHGARHVDCMNLEDVFCEIKTDGCNIAHGWLPLLVIFDDHHLGTSMPSEGHPPHQLAASASQPWSS